MVMSQEDTLYLEDVEPTIVRLIEGGLSMSTPAAEFSEKVNSNLLWGFSGAYLRQIRLEQPAFIGLEFYHAHIGSVRRTYSVILTDETIDVEGKMSSNIAGINLLGRYYSNLRLGPVEPFSSMKNPTVISKSKKSIGPYHMEVRLGYKHMSVMAGMSWSRVRTKRRTLLVT